MRILTMFIAIGLVLGVASPAAAETDTQPYTLTLGASVADVGLANVVCQGPPEGEICEENGIAPIGGGTLHAGQPYSNVIASINDDLFGASGGLSVCFYTGADNICDGDDVSSDTACGNVALLGSTQALSQAVFWVWTFVVTPDLEVCGGTTGSVSGTFF